MRILPESELIVNADGSVYHLHLLPGQVAANIITVGDPERVRRVSKHFDHIEYKKSNREFTTHTGLYNGKPVSVISTGIGTDNIDIVLTELDALVNVDIANRTVKEEKVALNIIRIGTSGSLHEDIEVDTVVASAYGLGFDNLLHYYKQDNSHKEEALLEHINKHIHAKKTNLNPYLYGASKRLLKHVANSYVQGITATCSGFYGPQGRHIRLKPAHADLVDRLGTYTPRKDGLRITNFEMETAGILGMAKLLGHDALSLSIIVANRVSKTFSTQYNKVMDATIVNVLDAL